MNTIGVDIRIGRTDECDGESPEFRMSLDSLAEPATLQAPSFADAAAHPHTVYGMTTFLLGDSHHYLQRSDPVGNIYIESVVELSLRQRAVDESYRVLKQALSLAKEPVDKSLMA